MAAALTLPDLSAAVKRVVRLLLQHAGGGLADDVLLVLGEPLADPPSRDRARRQRTPGVQQHHHVWPSQSSSSSFSFSGASSGTQWLAPGISS